MCKGYVLNKIKLIPYHLDEEMVFILIGCCVHHVCMYVYIYKYINIYIYIYIYIDIDIDIDIDR